jgi:hypothetical protein
MNITERPKSWYEYYRVIKMFICILRGYQKVGMKLLQGDQKFGVNITG